MSDLLFGSEPFIPVEADRTCVLFGPNTGQIRHTHRVITLRGGTRPDDPTVESAAREHLQLSGGDAQGLRALIVDSGGLDSPAIFSVDVTTGELVSRPLPETSPNPMRPT